ncbi:YqcC family protein [Marinobacter sp. F3R08]|uniref:YqcC family protein n=1 Tax=Marinobacter sp. F3R08 TaxID=2841559 RepID=UPI001C09A6EE|nr:YqcC family protein [Marinobacter sp. F3R08]MBU2955171.1 YqcC family protein [Marinobacter sp. F3R08]
MTESGNLIGQVADCLLGIEMELRNLGLWESEAPPEEAFQSAQPFCLDTLEFTQWLQFVFVARMKVIIENDHALPSASGIAPMAEEHFRGRRESGDRLVRELEAIDRLLSGE